MSALQGTGQKVGGLVANYGDGLATNPAILSASPIALSDPNPFFQQLMTRPYLDQVEPWSLLALNVQYNFRIHVHCIIFSLVHARVHGNAHVRVRVRAFVCARVRLCPHMRKCVKSFLLQYLVPQICICNSLQA